MPRNPKSPEARAAEARHLASQLYETGLPDEVVRPIIQDMLEFAETGLGFTRTYRVPETPIAIVCVLSNQKHVTSRIRITRSP